MPSISSTSYCILSEHLAFNFACLVFQSQQVFHCWNAGCKSSTHPSNHRHVNVYRELCVFKKVSMTTKRIDYHHTRALYTQTLVKMNEELKIVVDNVNKMLDTNYNLMSFDSLPNTNLLQVLGDVLVKLDVIDKVTLNTSCFCAKRVVNVSNR